MAGRWGAGADGVWTDVVRTRITLEQNRHCLLKPPQSGPNRSFGWVNLVSPVLNHCQIGCSCLDLKGSRSHRLSLERFGWSSVSELLMHGTIERSRPTERTLADSIYSSGKEWKRLPKLRHKSADLRQVLSLGVSCLNDRVAESHKRCTFCDELVNRWRQRSRIMVLQ